MPPKRGTPEYEAWRVSSAYVEFCEECSQVGLVAMNRPEVKERLRQAHLGKKLSEEHKQNISQALSGRTLSEEHKQRIGQANLGKKRSEEANEKNRQAHLGKKHTEKARRNMSQAHKRPEVKERQSQASLRNWDDPEYIRKQMKARGVKPNKLELLMKSVIEEQPLDGWKYNGDGRDGSIIIGGKCPDFVNEEKRLIIEIYGDYWHEGQDPQERIDFFKQHGWDTLVIWEHEIKDLGAVTRSLFEFHGG